MSDKELQPSSLESGAGYLTQEEVARYKANPTPEEASRLAALSHTRRVQEQKADGTYQQEQSLQ
jgi:hypothetical protein